MVASTSAEGSRRSRPAATSRASATIARARTPTTPCAAISSGASAAIVAARGKRRCRLACGVSIGSPKAATKRPAMRVAAFTVTCWPRIARTAISNPSIAPGRRSPGWRSASGPSAAAISSGRHARSKRCFTRESTIGSAPASDVALTRDAQRLAPRRGRDRDPARVLFARAHAHRAQVRAALDRFRRRRSRAARGRRASRPSRRAGGTRGRRRASLAGAVAAVRRSSPGVMR